MEVISIVIGCMGRGVGVMREQIINSDTDKVCRVMLITAVMKSESILRKSNYQNRDWRSREVNDYQHRLVVVIHWFLSGLAMA